MSHVHNRKSVKLSINSSEGSDLDALIHYVTRMRGVRVYFSQRFVPQFRNGLFSGYRVSDSQLDELVEALLRAQANEYETIFYIRVNSEQPRGKVDVSFQFGLVVVDLARDDAGIIYSITRSTSY